MNFREGGRELYLGRLPHHIPARYYRRSSDLDLDHADDRATLRYRRLFALGLLTADLFHSPRA